MYSELFLSFLFFKKCEEIAYMLRSLDLNTSVEQSSVHAFTTQTVARLSPVDATLPQVLTLCEMVKRGIGVVRERMLLFALPFRDVHLMIALF
jgi:superfamily II RNA helicase